MLPVEECNVQFQSWIDKIIRKTGILFYRDQTAGSLADLALAADACKPTKIVEIGTLFGMSLRTWLYACPYAEVIAIDLSFQPFRETQHLIPVDTGKVTFIEKNVLTVDFRQLWNSHDRVLLFVDAHDLPGVPIMNHVLYSVIPYLPEKSVVVIDDLWHSRVQLDADSVKDFLEYLSKDKFDSLQFFEGFYAPYWNGGSFMGFAEVIPLLQWINANKIKLRFTDDSKAVYFEYGNNQSSTATGQKSPPDLHGCGCVVYNPFSILDSIPEPVNEAEKQVLASCKNARQAFSQGAAVFYVLEVFNAAKKAWPQMPEVDYCRALCLLSLGRISKALAILESSPASPKAKELTEAVHKWLSKYKRTVTLGKERLGLTLFAIPKAFKGHTAVIQRNALTSWKKLDPAPAIILFGDDPGVKEIAEELGVQHVPYVKRNPHGTPLVSSLFEQAQALAKTSIVAYCNADIILLNDFTETILYLQQELEAHNINKFLLSSQRVELDVKEHIVFDAGWQGRLQSDMDLNGICDYKAAIELFCFSRGLYDEVLPFGIGRIQWDQWLVWKAKANGACIIDGTESFMVVHQAHDYTHLTGGYREAWLGEEAQENKALAKGDTLGINEATSHFITVSGLFEGKPKEFVSNQALVQRRFIRGMHELKMGNPKAALDYLDDAHCRSVDGISAELCLARAMCLAELKNYTEARDLVSAVLVRYPDHEQAKRLSALLTRV